MKYLHKLKKIQYKEGAEAALANAKDHLKVAEQCAEHFIGIAHSHLIIACEELCKASALRLKYLAPNTPMQDLRTYFSSHTAKHKRIFEIFQAVCQWGATATLDNNKKDENSKMSVGDIISVALAVVIYFISKSQDSNNNISMEEIRIRGFYVDLAEGKYWRRPNDIFTANDFREHLLVVNILFEAIEDNIFKVTPKENAVQKLLMDLGYIEQRLENY